jgi:hypothetical protein
MGVPVSYPDNLGFVKSINNYIQSTNRPNTVTGKYLNWLFNAVAYLVGKALDNAGGVWYANVSQVDGGAPFLTGASDGGAGKVIQNTIEYNGSLVNISFAYVSTGKYAVIADQPIFEDIIDFGIQIHNNNVTDVGGIVSYGVAYITHDPDSPDRFFINTFDGINGGLPANGLLTNATVSINRPC